MKRSSANSKNALKSIDNFPVIQCLLYCNLTLISLKLNNLLVQNIPLAKEPEVRTAEICSPLDHTGYFLNPRRAKDPAHDTKLRISLRARRVQGRRRAK